jgi:hypothetical protein
MFYNRCHCYAFKWFEALCLLTICWLVCDHLLLRDFGPYGIIFTTMSLQLWGFPSFLKGNLLVIFFKLVDPKQGQLITEE